MATETTDVYINPSDGWTLVAESPSYVMIKPSNFHPWWVAVSNSTPAASHEGIPMGKDSRGCFDVDEPIAGNVYIRIKEPISREPQGADAHFGVLATTED